MLGLLQYRSWALSESYYSRMYPVISEAILRGHSLINKQTIGDYRSRIGAMLDVIDPETDKVRVTYDPWTGKEIIPVVKSGGKNIALIPIIGPLTKYGDACGYGMQDHARFISMALKDEQIHGIVLIMDTPGGTVDGTQEMGMLVKNASKPIGVFGDGMVASAGIWIASQAQVIVGNKNNPTEFGSIGVLMVLEDYSAMMEKGTIPKMTILRAPGSEDKARINPIEPVTAEMLDELTSELKEVRASFVSTVKSGRGDKLNVKAPGLFTGQMFDALTAKSIGLIDSVGTLTTAVSKVADLARADKKAAVGVTARAKNSIISTSARTSAHVNTKMKLIKLSALLGAAASLFTGSETEAKEVSLSEEQSAALEASEVKLTEMESAATQLTTENGAQKTKIAELEANVTALNTQVSTLTSEKTTLTEEKKKLNEDLAKKATGQLTTVLTEEEKEAKVKADGENSITGDEKYMTSVDKEAKALREQKGKSKTAK